MNAPIGQAKLRLLDEREITAAPDRPHNYHEMSKIELTSELTTRQSQIEADIEAARREVQGNIIKLAASEAGPNPFSDPNQPLMSRFPEEVRTKMEQDLQNLRETNPEKAAILTEICEVRTTAQFLKLTIKIDPDNTRYKLEPEMIDMIQKMDPESNNFCSVL